jgi:hypothetical protein
MIPITAVRRRVSPTVVWPTPTYWAIIRTLAPQVCFSRKTSRIFFIDNLSAGIASPNVIEDHATVHGIADVAPGRPFRVCPQSIGISVPFAWNTQWTGRAAGFLSINTVSIALLRQAVFSGCYG